MGRLGSNAGAFPRPAFTNSTQHDMLFKPKANVFDIGAHHGNTASLFIERNAGQVVAVEPLLANYLALLKLGAVLSPCAPKLHAVHAAVHDDHLGVALIHACKEQDGLSTMHPEDWAVMYSDKTFYEREFVATVTIADLAQTFGPPDFIKVDVEGHETWVILSLCDYITSKPRVAGDCPPIVFEFHGARIRDAVHCMELLKGIGYKLAGWYPTDVNLDLVPARPVDEVKEELWNTIPGWGNIVML